MSNRWLEKGLADLELVRCSEQRITETALKKKTRQNTKVCRVFRNQMSKMFS